MTPEDEAIAREHYTWDKAAQDLALMTRWKLLDAARVAASLEGLVHPYDALPHLLVLTDGGKGAAEQGKALAQLILLGRETP